MLMLPDEDTVLSCWGESSREMISAPWSVRALADSRKLSLWLSICGETTGPRSKVAGGTRRLPAPAVSTYWTRGFLCAGWSRWVSWELKGQSVETGGG